MKILSAAPSNTEILYSLGLEHQIVGTTSLCDFPKKAIKKPSIGGWSEGVNYQKIRELNPDIILLSDQLQDEQASKLEKEGFETIQVRPESLTEVFKSIKKIGRKFDREEEASKIVTSMKTEIESIDLNGKRIYCEEWMDPPMVSGNWIPGLIKKANGDYFIEEGRSREFSLENLKEFDPEYIFLNVCGAGENVNSANLKKRQGWENISAIQISNVYVVNDRLLNRPTPSLVQGLRKIRSALVK